MPHDNTGIDALYTESLQTVRLSNNQSCRC
ncbi:hypothetical protein GCK32_021057 [Trichostrongylus colubriformis]|uniref:Uncharacterized protein n=1 Tax=Trichostrongylus colubriformis TaxID=6319 RepID=A0AAN8IL86_TRICO